MTISFGFLGVHDSTPVWLRALLDAPAFRLHAICDFDASKARLAPAVPFHRHTDDLLEDHRLQAVAIGGEAGEQFALVRAALYAGKHVLLEFPATGEENLLAELAAMARDLDRRLVVALPSQFNEEVSWFSRLLALKGRDEYGVVNGFEIQAARAPSLNPFAPQEREDWLGSGAECLAALSRFLPLRSLTASDLSFSKAPFASETSSGVRFSFPVGGYRDSGRGIVRWESSESGSKTWLRFERTRDRILLDHRGRRVVLLGEESGRSKVLADFGSQGDYDEQRRASVLAEFAKHLETGTDNTAHARSLLRLAQTAGRIVEERLAESPIAREGVAR